MHRSILFYLHLLISGLHHHFSIQCHHPPLAGIPFKSTITAYRNTDIPVTRRHYDTISPFQDEIAYLETAGRKTAVHTREERIEYTVPLSKLKEEFQKQGFCLSHFSYLVNLAHVARVERDALTLDTGEAIPVSRRYYQDFMARYVESLK